MRKSIEISSLLLKEALGIFEQVTNSNNNLFENETSVLILN